VRAPTEEIESRRKAHGCVLLLGIRRDGAEERRYLRWWLGHSVRVERWLAVRGPRISGGFCEGFCGGCLCLSLRARARY